MTTLSRKEFRRRMKKNADSILKGANPEQADAIQHHNGPIGVFAGAGSGKTRVLVHRIAMLVHNGVNPERILSVTFSKKAADEMAARARSLGVTKARVGTWHSLALQILREDGLLDGYDIDDSDRAKNVILKAEVLGYKGMNWRDADLGVVNSFIGYCKSQLWAPDSAEALAYAREMGPANKYLEAYSRYEMALEDNGMITFDCMLVKAVRHLQQSEDNRLRWAARWDYVLQDEAQDANPAQMTLALLLARDHRNYMIVGDPAQSIYGWRGSKPEYVMEFEKEWEGAKVVTMNRNYRCGRKIIDAANTTIRPATMKLPLDLVAEGGWEGGVSWWREANLEAEAERIASIVMQNTSNGAKYEEHTVLFRTNAQSRALEESFLNHRIPYVVVGGTSFYDRKEVKDLLCYLRLACGRDVEASLRRCINAPFRFIGVKTVDKILGRLKGDDLEAVFDAVKYAISSDRLQSRQVATLQEWMEVVASVSAAKGTKEGQTAGTVLDALESEINYIQWLRQDQGEEGIDSSHVANVKELIRVGERFESIEALLDYIEETRAKADKAKREGNKGRCLLMSIHRSKGLEWNYVFVAGASDGILPHPKGDPEEERRLFYVATTRAAQHCYVTSPTVLAMRNGVKEVGISPFVVELLDAGVVSRPASGETA